MLIKNYPQLKVAMSVMLLAIIGAVWGKDDDIVSLVQERVHSQELPVITVCPEGPPVCQFSKIQEAINAAPESNYPGPWYTPAAEIHIAPGTYEENLLIRKSVILKGAGNGKTILRAPRGGRETITIILIVWNFSGVEAYISGLTFQGNQQRGRVGIHIIGDVSAVIQNNRFEGVDYSVLIEHSIGPTVIKDNVFIGLGIPCRVMATNLGKIDLVDNKFQLCGIGIAGARRYPAFIPPPSPQPGDLVQIKRNHISEGAITINSSTGVVIQNNIMEKANNPFGGISILDSQAIAVQANTLTQSRSLYGIEVEGSEVVISSNRIEGGARNGVGVVDPPLAPPKASRVQLVSNQIIKNEWFGVLVSKEDYLILCQDNQVHSNGRGDYGVIGEGPDPRPSPELKQKCEGG